MIEIEPITPVFLFPLPHQSGITFDDEVFTYRNIYNGDSCGMPADVTLFKTIIKIKDRAKFKHKFLGDDYDQVVVEDPFEPVAVIRSRITILLV